MIATESVAGVGIDEPNVLSVLKSGFSPSIHIISQMLGRLLWQFLHHELHMEEYGNFTFVFLLDLFAYLFERSCNTERKQLEAQRAAVQNGRPIPHSILPKELRSLQIDELYDVLDLFAMKCSCVHQ